MHRLGKQTGEERNEDEVWYIGKGGKDVRKTQDWRECIRAEEGELCASWMGCWVPKSEGGGKCVEGMTVQCPGS